MTTQNETLNGIDLKQLHGTVDAIKGDSEIAHFEFLNSPVAAPQRDGAFPRSTLDIRRLYRT